MIDFGSKIYYIDFNKIDKLVGGEKSLKPQSMSDVEETIIYDANDEITGRQVTTSKYYKGKEIDLSKYDILKIMIEVLFDDETLESDTTLGPDRILNKTSLSYKIAFNTLLQYGILKEKEEE